MRLSDAVAATPRPDGDTAASRRGIVRAVDYTGRRIEVAVYDDTISEDEEETLVIPYVGYIDDYEVGNIALIQREPTGYIATGCIGLAQEVSADASAGTTAVPTGLALDRSNATVTATWDDNSETNYRLRTSKDGGTTWAPTVFTTSQSKTFGIQQGTTLTVQISGYTAATGWSAWSSSKSVTYPEPVQQYETVTTTIYPSDSGTWRVDAAAWDRWNTDRWDGRRGFYQADPGAYGSGVLVGWAGYGSRVKDLHAVEIKKIVVKVKRNGWGDYGSRKSVTVQGCANGSRPSSRPTGSGGTSTTGSVYMYKTTSCELGSALCENFRTGDIRSLIAAGTQAAGWYGTSGSFVLVVTYVRKV